MGRGGDSPHDFGRGFTIYSDREIYIWVDEHERSENSYSKTMQIEERIQY